MTFPVTSHWYPRTFLLNSHENPIEIPWTSHEISWSPVFSTSFWSFRGLESSTERHWGVTCARLYFWGPIYQVDNQWINGWYIVNVWLIIYGLYMVCACIYILHMVNTCWPSGNIWIFTLVMTNIAIQHGHWYPLIVELLIEDCDLS